MGIKIKKEVKKISFPKLVILQTFLRVCRKIGRRFALSVLNGCDREKESGSGRNKGKKITTMVRKIKIKNKKIQLQMEHSVSLCSGKYRYSIIYLIFIYFQK